MAQGLEEEELQGHKLLEKEKKKGKLSITIQQTGFRMRGNYRGDSTNVFCICENHRNLLYKEL